ncbi:YbhN family protein [Actinophytocola sediminis]
MASNGEQRIPRLLKVILKFSVAVALLIVAAVSLRDRLPGAGEVTAALRTADPGWLAAAVLAELVSIGMFARQQRRLLTAFGVRLTRHRAIALAYARSAIAISLPAGSALSAAYAFGQFRTSGASRHTAATVMVLSGLLSMAALALLYVTGALTAAGIELARAWHEHPVLTRITVMLVLGMVGFIGMLAWRSMTSMRMRGPRRPRTVRPRVLVPVLDAVARARAIPGRHWAPAVGAALANWLTDLLCLFAAARAFQLPLDPVTLGVVYLTVQLVRQVPLTPGGIGVIEISLLAGLIAAGAGEAAAAATVLVYRLLSCWLVIPVGLASWLGLRRPPRGSELVGGALDDQLGRPGVLGHGLGEHRGRVGPRRDVGDQQPAHPGVLGEPTGLGAGQV